MWSFDDDELIAPSTIRVTRHNFDDETLVDEPLIKR